MRSRDAYDDAERLQCSAWADSLDWLSWRRWLRRSRQRIRNGYLQVYDYGEQQWKWIHRAVAEEKLGGPVPEGFEVHHINGDKLDNSPDNLAVLPREIHREIHKEAREAAARGEDYTQALVDAYRARTSFDISASHTDGNSVNDNCEAVESPGVSPSETRLTDAAAIVRALVQAGVLQSRRAQSGSTPRAAASFGVHPIGSWGSCPRCGGTGYLPEFSHVAGGTCFLCGGGSMLGGFSGEGLYDLDDGYQDDYGPYDRW